MTGRATQLIRYSGTAGIAAVVDVGLFALLHGAGVPLAAAAALSFLLATIANYILTARYVFHFPLHLSGYLRFLAAASLGFVLNVGTTMIAAQGLGLPATLAKIVGIGLAFLANFTLNAFFVFRAKALSDPGGGLSEK